MEFRRVLFRSTDDELKAKNITPEKSYDERVKDFNDKFINNNKTGILYNLDPDDLCYKIYFNINGIYQVRLKELNKQRNIKIAIGIIFLIIILCCCSSSVYFLRKKKNVPT